MPEQIAEQTAQPTAEPTGASTAASDPATVVRLADVRDTALDVAEVLAAVEDPAAGGVTLFVGAVRDHDREAAGDADRGDKAVAALEYSAHPSALARLEEVLAQVAGRHQVTALAAVHRVGLLRVGDLAVVVAAAAPHRAEAFDASRDLIDTLKATVPIWKHQQFVDGTEEWVGTP